MPDSALPFPTAGSRREGRSPYQMSLRRREAQSFHPRIMKRRAELLDLLRFSMRPGSVGEQRHAQATLGIDPHGRARIPEVSIGGTGKVMTGRGWLGYAVPSQPARVADRKSTRLNSSHIPLS